MLGHFYCYAIFIENYSTNKNLYNIFSRAFKFEYFHIDLRIAFPLLYYNTNICMLCMASRIFYILTIQLCLNLIKSISLKYIFHFNISSMYRITYFSCFFIVYFVKCCAKNLFFYIRIYNKKFNI